VIGLEVAWFDAVIETLALCPSPVTFGRAIEGSSKSSDGEVCDGEVCNGEVDFVKSIAFSKLRMLDLRQSKKIKTYPISGLSCKYDASPDWEFT
jgi:hypothetical protein